MVRLPPVARTGRSSGVQGQALLVTFAAIGKSDWPRAAMEREGGKRQRLFSRPFDGLRVTGGASNDSSSLHLPPHPNPLPRGERGQNVAKNFLGWYQFVVG